jgi:hypothetical protein
VTPHGLYSKCALDGSVRRLQAWMLRWGLTSLPEYRGNPLEPIDHEARISRIHDAWVGHCLLSCRGTHKLIMSQP